MVFALALFVTGAVLTAAAGAVLWGYWWILEPKRHPRGFDVLPPK